MDIRNEKPNICIVRFPISKKGVIPLSNLIDINYPFSKQLYVISGNECSKEISDKNFHYVRMDYIPGSIVLSRIVKYLYINIKISLELIKINKKNDINLFIFFGNLLLPMLTAKIIKKKIILILPGSASSSSYYERDTLHFFIDLDEKICKIASNFIVVYTPKLITEYNLQKYHKKVLIFSRHFIEISKFKIKKKFTEREDTVGYIGGLAKLKGVPQLLEAIPKILERKKNVKFVIGGYGPLLNEIEEFIYDKNLNDKVDIIGWIDHDELPSYLNKMKLLVVPSYTEGLPNIVLEAMACGTPVLATPVGGIPDIIKNGKTGFIMENNSPECITKNVVRALEYPDLDRIIKNARKLIENEYTYEPRLAKYRYLLNEVLGRDEKIQV